MKSEAEKSKFYSIVVDYDAEKNDKKIRARSIYHVEAHNIPHAYKKARRALENNGLGNFKLGAIVNGQAIKL